MWSPIVRQWAPVRKLPNGKVSWIVGPWEFAQELTKSGRKYPSIPYFCLLIKAVLNPNFWIPCGGMLQVRSLLSIHQPYSMRLECFNMLFAQEIVTSCVKNFKEMWMENLTKSGYGRSSIGRLLQTSSPPHQLHCLTEELWLCCNSCATMRSERMWLDHQRSKVMAFF